MIRLFQDKQWESHKGRLKDLFYWLGWTGIALIAMMKIQGWPVRGVYYWALMQPAVFSLTYLMILAIFCLFHALVYDRFMAMIFSMYTLLSFAVVQHFKRLYLEENFLPWDLLMLPDMVTLLPSLDSRFILVGLMFFLFIPMLIYVCYKVWKLKNNHLIHRTGLILFSISFFAALMPIIKVPVLSEYLTELSRQNNLHVDYQKNGLMLSFALVLRQIAEHEPPELYSKDTLRRIISNPFPIQSSASPAIQPNVIIFMSEALFDPTELPLTYSKDPLQHFHALQQKYGHSSLVSPSFGGDTCNTEFEVMTGFSMNFFSKGIHPYESHIRKDLPALPRIFKENGYYTLGIHPYYGSFFNREKVYQFLGFDDYYSIEDWDNPEKVGEYVSDRDLVRIIIEKSESIEGPYFIYAISLQNHLSFTTPLDPELNTLSGRLSKESQQTLDHYLAGVQDADNALQSLVEHLAKSSRPTILVFFGDHLPTLTTVYQETDYFAISDNPLAKYTVPALIWSNYKDIPPLDSVSTFYLGRYVLEQAGLTPPLHFHFLGQLFDKHPVISYGHTEDSQIEDYSLIQYDLISGKQYLLSF